MVALLVGGLLQLAPVARAEQAPTTPTLTASAPTAGVPPASVATTLEPAALSPVPGIGPAPTMARPLNAAAFVDRGAPPGNGVVLSSGQLPGVCSEGDYTRGASAYGSNYGYYWSDKSNMWVSAPWCFPRWGYFSMSTATTISPGGTVTATLIPDDARAGSLLSVRGGVSWSFPGTRVSGCETRDLTCTVKVGDAAKPPSEWQWGEFHASAPGRVFILPDSYGRCLASDPCLDTQSNAWTFVGVRPDTQLEVDFGVTPVSDQPGAFTFNATSVGNVTPEFEWDFGDDSKGVATPTSHTYAKPGTYLVTLTGTAGNVKATKAKSVLVQPPSLEVRVMEAEPLRPV